MKTLTVGLAHRGYDLHIGPDLLAAAGTYCRAALPGAKRLVVVSDSNVAPLYAKKVLDSLTAAGFAAALITIPAGETSKSLVQLGALYDGFMAHGLTRTDGVVALGGGVVGDLAGFAAATILRGVALVQLPTTLLAQVDSSVGGKVAIDLPAGKNLAGAFWQPRLVLMDTTCLATLSDKIFADGMAEVLKYGCIADEAFFAQLEKAPTRTAVMAEIESVLYTCCDLKRGVVEKDEFDTGERMLLNFGHTLGHAYEKAGHYEVWTHGAAVAAGMCRAAELGVKLGVTPTQVPARIQRLVAALGLPVHIDCTAADYAAAIGLDKKGAGDEISVILLRAVGKAVIHNISKEQLLTLI